MATFFGQKCPNHVVFRGCNISLQEDRRVESRFDVFLKYWKMSTKIKNDSVINFFYGTLI